MKVMFGAFNIDNSQLNSLIYRLVFMGIFSLQNESQPRRESNNFGE